MTNFLKDTAIDFEAEQQNFENRAEAVFKVQKKYQMFFDNYYKMDETILDAGLLSYIEREGDQNIVVSYIDYQLSNNPNDLNNHSLLKLENLKNCLTKNNLNGVQDYVRKIVYNSIEACTTTNFEIIGGEIETKIYKLGETNHIAKSKIQTAHIKKGLYNKYRLTLKTEIPNKIYKFDIKYNNEGGIIIFDQFGIYIGKSNIEYKSEINIEGNSYRKDFSFTTGMVQINTGREKIKLDLMFKN